MGIALATLKWADQLEKPEALARAVLGALCGFGLSAGIRAIPALLPWKGWGRIVRPLAAVALILILWEFLGWGTRWPVPSPSLLGHWLSHLPHSALCRWIAGGDTPGQVVAWSTAFSALFALALWQTYRDRSGEIESDEIMEGSELTAEHVAASLIRHGGQWQRMLVPRPGSDEEFEDDDDDEDESSQDNGRNDPEVLLHHPDAPREHAAPVAPEFREAMAKEVRRLLTLPAAEGPAARYLMFRGWNFAPLGRLLRWSALAGAVAPVLFMAGSLASQRGTPPWISSGLTIAAICFLVAFWFFPAGSSFWLPALTTGWWGGEPVVTWAWLPIAMCTHYQAFLVWSWRAHLRRLAMAAVLFVSFAISAHLFQSFLLAADLVPRDWPSPASLWNGLFSLPQFGIALASGLFVARAGGIQAFAAPLTAGFQGRGGGRSLYLIALLSYLLSVVLAGATGFACLAAGSTGRLFAHWRWFVPLFIAAEIFRALTLHTLLFYVNRGRGDAEPKRGG